jgi:hypothetical protein
MSLVDAGKNLLVGVGALELRVAKRRPQPPFTIRAMALRTKVFIDVGCALGYGGWDNLGWEFYRRSASQERI